MSKIDTKNIDETYPVAGINNPSQGFRDNFSNIKKNLNLAKDEIENLEINTIRKETDNDFKGHYIKDANLYSCTETMLKGGILLDNYNLSFNDATYHSYIIGDDVSISLNDFPINRYARLIVEITGSSDTEQKVTFLGPSSKNTIKYNNTWPINSAGRFIKLTSANIFVIEFWSIDAGNTIFSNLIGQY